MGGAATQASIFHPKGVAFDAIGNLYISSENGYIRKVDTTGIISTIAGTTLANGGIYASEAPAIKMNFKNPTGLVVDNERNYLYVADTGYNRIVRIDLSTGIATTIAGTGECNVNALGDGGAALSASLCQPQNIGLDSAGNVLVHDFGNKRIRKISFNASAGGTISYLPTNKDHSNLKRNSDGTWTRTYRNNDKAYFTSSGLQYAYVDNIGNQTIFDYNSIGEISSVTYPTGQKITIEYVGNKIKSIVDPTGKVTNFDYSGTFLSKILYPDGTSLSYEYDSKGLLVKETNQMGRSKRYTYNEWGRLSEVVESDNSKIVVNDSTSQTMSNNYTGGAIGRLQGPGIGAEQIHDVMIDAKEITTESSKDFNGFITKMVNGEGQMTLIERDLLGYPLKIKFSDSSVITMSYDPLTRDLISTTDESTGITESTQVDSFGRVVKEIDGRGVETSYVYNSNTGLLLTKKIQSQIVKQFTYYSNGLVKTETTFSQNDSPIVVNYEYDNNGNVTKVIRPDGKYISFVNDLAGNRTKSITSPDGSSASTASYEYDSFNRLKKVVTPNGEITHYGYISTGELSEIIDPQGKQTSFEYNIRGLLSKKTDSRGAVWLYAYDPNGNMQTKVDPVGNQFLYTYDRLNRLTGVQSPDDQVANSYDIRGQLIQTKNLVSQIDFVRDTKKRMKSSIVSGLGTMVNYPAIPINYDYDDSGNRKSLSTQFGTISYFYNEKNKVTQIVDLNGGVIRFSYDDSSKISSIQRPGSNSFINYNSGGVPNLITHNLNSSENVNIGYSYDSSNRIIQKRINGIDSNYSYDLSGQLTGSSGNVSESFTYDPLGNRITDQNTNYIYDTSSQLLKEDNFYVYNYDYNGNLTQKISKTPDKESYLYSYYANNHLKQVRTVKQITGPVIKQVDFVYDALGRRMQKTVTDSTAQSDLKRSFTRKYIYDGSNVLFEMDSLNNLIVGHTHNIDQPDDVLSSLVTQAGVTSGIAQSQGAYYYLKDLIGSITAITNQSGSTVQKFEYLAFGKMTITDELGADITAAPRFSSNFTFTGQQWDAEIGLYYFKARYFDPLIGRFIQSDPDSGSIKDPITVVNKYAYAANRPTYITDPSGRFVWYVVAIIIGLSAAYQGAQNYKGAKEAGYSEGKAMNVFWSGFITGALTGTLTAFFPGSVAWFAAANGAINNFANQTILRNEGQVIDWGSIFISGLVGGVIGKFAGTLASNAFAETFQLTSRGVDGLGGGLIGIGTEHILGSPINNGVPRQCEVNNCLSTQVP